MTSPLAVMTSAINVVVRPRTKLPKPPPAKAGNFHECMDDGRALLEQLHVDASPLNGRHRTLRYFIICSAVDERSRRRVARQLKHGCGFHESTVVLDPAADAATSMRFINQQLKVLHECNNRIKHSEAHVQHVHKRDGDEGSEVVVSYITFTLELKWS